MRKPEKYRDSKDRSQGATTFLVCSSHFFSYCSFILDLSKIEMIYRGKLHVCFVFNHKQICLK